MLAAYSIGVISASIIVALSLMIDSQRVNIFDKW